MNNAALVSSNSSQTLREKIEIKNIIIEHFKKIDSATLTFEKPVTYLVGTNRSGKSSFLQAIMMMIATAQEFRGQKDRNVEINMLEHQLRYCPTHDFERIGHKSPLENKKDGYKALVKLNLSIENKPYEYGISFRKARGEKNISLGRTHDTAANVSRIIQDQNEFFSVYVPGISGIAKKEEKVHKKHVYHSMFGGNANILIRNILLLINNDQSTNKEKTEDLKKLERELSEILGDTINFEIHYDYEQSPDIEINVEKEDYKFPLELCSMGELQLIQIIGYWILLKPKIILLDEPDSHLHANTQTLLAQYLANTAKEEGTKVLVATHSRQLIASANAATKEDTQLLLIEEGKISDTVPETIDCLMHLGALDAIDKQIIIFSEDTNTKYLEALLNQWEDIRNNYKIISYNGINNIWEARSKLETLLHFMPHVITFIHRDRDFLTDDQIKHYAEDKKIPQKYLFCTKYCDIETYFLNHIEKRVNNLELKDYEHYGDFCKKREGAISSITSKAGRDFPDHKVHWDTLSLKEKLSGKDVISKIRNKHKILEENIIDLSSSTEKLAPDLKDFIDGLNLNQDNNKFISQKAS